MPRTLAGRCFLNYAAWRERMVERDIIVRGITDRNVISAMRHVPREEFVRREQRRLAYDDAPLPIARGQTISQPYIVAVMLEALELSGKGDETVLDVGTGSGYAAAVLSMIAERVFTIERHEDLALQARERFERLGYDNVEVRVGDGTRGWAQHAPYPAILVSAAASAVPPVLKEQLAVGGRLVVPVGGAGLGQHLLRVRRLSEERFEEDPLTAVRFVPLVVEESD